MNNLYGKDSMKSPKANLITAVVMLLAYLAANLIAPELGVRWKLLIAILAGIAASAVIYCVLKRKKEKEEEDKLPPV